MNLSRRLCFGIVLIFALAGSASNSPQRGNRRDIKADEVALERARDELKKLEAEMQQTQDDLKRDRTKLVREREDIKRKQKEIRAMEADLRRDRH